jgi:hypothetical protein
MDYIAKDLLLLIDQSKAELDKGDIDACKKTHDRIRGMLDYNKRLAHFEHIVHEVGIFIEHDGLEYPHTLEESCTIMRKYYGELNEADFAEAAYALFMIEGRIL